MIRSKIMMTLKYKREILRASTRHYHHPYHAVLKLFWSNPPAFPSMIKHRPLGYFGHVEDGQKIASERAHKSIRERAKREAGKFNQLSV